LLTNAAVSGCGGEEDFGFLSRSLSAFCTVNVTGKGTKQVETDYLPHVVACENGGADTEALKAQAVAARSYMHYKINLSGAICDGTGCQVYTCGNKPTSKHYDAVKATAGQVLRWGGITICAFYVAGAKPKTSSCKGNIADNYTEKYVTYNWGKSGSSITQSTLGWVNPGNKYNRGCKSQNGANCLSKNGWKYPNILKFYYGSDIQLLTTTGPCVNPVKPDSGPPPPDKGKPPPDKGKPKPDKSVPKPDKSVPKPDKNKPPGRDFRPPVRDHQLPQGDFVTPYSDVYPSIHPEQYLLGGCSAVPGAGDLNGAFCLLLALVWVRKFSR